MTRSLFDEWVKDFDAKMKTQNRSILLMLDNVTLHSKQFLDSSAQVTMNMRQLGPIIRQQYVVVMRFIYLQLAQSFLPDD